MNGIPQGSPLSVVLFQIAFNKISKIIEKNRYINHCLYAKNKIFFKITKVGLVILTQKSPCRKQKNFTLAENYAAKRQ